MDADGCPGSGFDCMWGEWEAGSCSVTCGAGVRTEFRRPIQNAVFGGAPCRGPSIQERPCQVPTTCPPPSPPGEKCKLLEKQNCCIQQIFMIVTVDCAWGPFVWGACSATCGFGIQNGFRQPNPSASNGGRPCSGSAFDQRPCEPALPTCPPGPSPGEKCKLLEKHN